MKGLIVHNVGGDFALVEDIERPKPGPSQVLVKSLATAINPVEEFMQSTGMLVTAWPIVLGCDASGVVVELGSDVQKFEVGNKIFGCTRLGVSGHSTFQEYFLMDENLAFKAPPTISIEAAATIGVGLLTACLGLINGLKMKLEPDSAPDLKEWVVILGASGSVGQYAVQVAKLSGYKVLASCSPSSNQFVKDLGADRTFNYKTPLAEQLTEIKYITQGNFHRCFDASSMAAETGMECLDQCGIATDGIKYFATTNGWIPIAPKEGIEIHLAALGLIGRSGSEASKVNKEIEEFIPTLEKFLRDGRLKPMEYQIIGDFGVGEVLKGLESFNARKNGEKKVVVRVALE